MQTTPNFFEPTWSGPKMERTRHEGLKPNEDFFRTLRNLAWKPSRETEQFQQTTADFSQRLKLLDYLSTRRQTLKQNRTCIVNFRHLPLGTAAGTESFLQNQKKNVCEAKNWQFRVKKDLVHDCGSWSDVATSVRLTPLLSCKVFSK